MKIKEIKRLNKMIFMLGIILGLYFAGILYITTSPSQYDKGFVVGINSVLCK